ncbi:MAG: RtcB family protein [Nitrospirota bacterium]|nr:RtcB family protein [Nitrospirota bacterium]
MKIIKVEGGLMIKSWSDVLEVGALEQARNLARLPFAFRHISLMADAHQGYGMPIGGVMATEDVIVPNAVGVDIGCGMCAAKTSLHEISVDALKKIIGEIRRRIPVGMNRHRDRQDPVLMPAGNTDIIVDREYGHALHQIGTLGSGNHFIQFSMGSDGHIWVMVHSGSRNLGKQVADFYNRKAVELNDRMRISVPKAWDLASLPINSAIGQAYQIGMTYSVDFALANRKLMMNRIAEIVYDTTGGTFDEMINIAHNYAKLESHFGKNVIVHRKGATSARDGEIGIIPGSQGTASYIVRGKGNSESFQSCSHGAGRKMGRKQAERTLNLEEEKKRLDDKGIIHAVRGVRDLDEADGAYKDIDIVIASQADLVDIIVKLDPLGVIKG